MSEPATYGTLLALAEEPLETLHGDFRLHRFHDLARRLPVLALTTGDFRTAAPLLARVHSSCVTSEVLGGLDCDCAAQLDQSLAEIARAGRGIVFYLLQEGRGAGLFAKARDRMLVQASGQRLTTFEAYRLMGLGSDQRRYEQVGAMCRLLGVSAPLRLLTNNPEKLAALGREGLAIEGVVGLRHAPSSFNLHYLAAKSRSGHDLPGGVASERAAEPPGPLESFEPRRLPAEPSLVALASYWLPIRVPGAGDASWFHLHVYFDLAQGEERLVLTHGPEWADACLVSVHGNHLLDRFPLRTPSAERRAWQAMLVRIADAGAGCVLLRDADQSSGSSPAAECESRRPLGAADWKLLAHHLHGRRARLAGAPGTRVEELGARLVELGIQVEVA